MVLIIGLGNPGKKYEKTRHNIGSRVIDELKSLNLEGMILSKPQTFFMNESGKAVKILTTKYKIQDTNLWVVHDDIDLPLGALRIAKNRGSAGHKGVESIIRELKTKDFVRFRIGIKSKQSYRLVCGTEKFVLQKFSKDEEKIVKEVIKKTVGAIEFSLKEGVEKAMSKFNK